MNVSNKVKALSRAAAESGVILLLLCALVPRLYGQNQAQPASADSAQISETPKTSEVPPAVVKELQEVKARMARMESQLKDLTAFVAPAGTFAVRSPRPAPTEVTLTGTVSCGHCQGIQPTHKGYTPFSWALNSVNQGDSIVLLVQDKTYELQGDKERILKFMSTKARATGQLSGDTLAVETIGRAAKNE
jgi:hypothetical protein